MDDPKIAKLIAQLRDKEKYVRSSAAVSALIEALKDSDGFVRGCAAQSLGRLGDSSATPALIQALHDKDSIICRSAAEALWHLGDSVTLPRKILAAPHFATEERIALLDSLRRIPRSVGMYPFPATRTLCETVLQEADAEARAGAQAALNWLEGRTLLRGSQRDPAIDAQELLRAAQSGASQMPPDALLRATDEPNTNPQTPASPSTLWQRLFGKRHKPTS